jgi:membrane protease YdiL (CAAX protease family)
MREIAARLPPGPPARLFWMLAVPAMIFSPLGEEILYRGLLQSAFGRAAGARSGRIVPALLFGFAHLSQFGLVPLQPWLLLLWLPSMFGVALLFAWVRERSGSLYPAMVCHAAFNLALTAAAWAWIR